MQKDTEMPGFIPRNSNIPEELGRVHYLLTDKTGTLTRNEMVLKKLGLLQTEYNLDYSPDVRRLGDKIRESVTSSIGDHYGEDVRPQEQIHRDVIGGIALCNMVTPITIDNSTSYMASSPDEIALVKFAKSEGLILSNRVLSEDFEEVTLVNQLGQQEHYTVLEMIPFSSETKRMGVILQDHSSGRIVYFVKGSDSRIVPMLKKHPNL